MKITGFYSSDIAFEIWIAFRVGKGELSLHELFHFCLVTNGNLPTAHARVGDDERQLRDSQVFPNVLHKVNQVLLIDIDSSLIDTIVPTLVPTETDDFITFARVVRVIRL